MSKGAVVIVVYDGVQLLDVAGPIEVFDGARRALGNSYRGCVASVGGRDIMASADVRLGVELDLTELDADLDAVVVAGSWG